MRSGLPRSRRLVAIVAIAAAAAFACNAISGLDDLTTEVPADGGRSNADGPVVEPPKSCPSEGRHCVRGAPAGWMGPLVVYDVDSAKGAASCPANMALAKIQGHVGEPTGEITCSACTCGAPDTTCSATLYEYGAGGCGDAPVKTLLGATCVTKSGGTSAIRIYVDAGATSCPADGGVAGRTLSWPGNLIACGAPELLADGCAAGEVCAPDPPATFRPKHCIAKAGSDACPAPWTVKRDAFTGVTDTRECSPCTCKPPTAIACTGRAQLYPTVPLCNAASGGSSVLVPTVACTSVSTQVAGKLTALQPSSGSCEPEVSAPLDGGLVTTDPFTVCCEP